MRAFVFLAAALLTSPLAGAFGEVAAVTSLPGFNCYTAPTFLANKSQLVTLQRQYNAQQPYTDASVIARIRSDGSLDPAFGQGGLAIIPTELNAGSAHIQLASGKLLVVGERVLRINANGSLDATYGSGGATEIAFAATPYTAAYLSHAAAADGSIVMLGRQSGAAGTLEVVFTRFTADGRRDQAFGVGGFLRAPLAWDEIIFAWSLQANGAIDVASYKSGAGTPGSQGLPIEPRLMRFSPYQWVMSEFQPGTRTIPEQGLASWTSPAVKVDAFGGVVIASMVEGSRSSEVMLSRFGVEGNPDRAFGNDGRIVVPAGPAEPGSTYAIGSPSALWNVPGGGWHVLVSQSTRYGVGFFGTTTSSNVLLRFNSAGGQDPTAPRSILDFLASRGSFTQLDDGHLMASQTSLASGCNVVKVEVGPPRAENTLVEYYHPGIDHYFMTLEGLETQILDDNVAAMGWVRTGQKFGSWAAVSLPGTARVCRFYGDLIAGPNSHFYIPQGAGCDGLRQLEANAPLGTAAWRLEGLTFATREAFFSQCPANLTPVQRYYNRGYEQGRAANHRYAVDPAIGAEMAAKGWAAEGIAFCMPPQAPRTAPAS